MAVDDSAGEVCAGPGERVGINVDLVTPTTPGRYQQYFRLQDGQGNRFGQPIWIDLTVAEPGRWPAPAPRTNRRVQSAPAAAAHPHAAAVTQLVAMGFTEPQAAQAAATTQGAVGQAVELLLAQGVRP